MSSRAHPEPFSASGRSPRRISCSMSSSENGLRIVASAPVSSAICGPMALIWQNLSPRNLVSFPILDAAMAALPGYHLHRRC
jgi:hypothetical protein